MIFEGSLISAKVVVIKGPLSKYSKAAPMRSICAVIIFWIAGFAW